MTLSPSRRDDVIEPGSRNCAKRHYYLADGRQSMVSVRRRRLDGLLPGPSNSRRPFRHWDLAEPIVPVCSVRPEDVSIGFESDIAIEAPRGHDQPSTFQLHARKCRPASRAKAFTVSRGWKREARDLVFPSDPPQGGPGRKQVGCVC
jgi:hypothetical protein